ncbi:MAG: tRNA pseudouridine(38-40) synthase TruA [Erysipelotrichaceae bacterium]|nr:tRNA pseudouridine(38-40) synthase TruA [Erysipelotrichaceae bacterium]
MRVKCIVSYDGSQFHGFQIQKNQRTVQGEIQKALKKINEEEVIIHASGRTDAKVHAIHQVFHFDTKKNLPANQWKRAINHFMPNDIYILDACYVDESFHSRYSAVKKEYRYLLNMKEYNPFQTDYVYQYGRQLDIELMRDAAQIFLGEHNFASFCTYDLYGNTIRTLYSFDIDEQDGIVTFTLVGNGFRRYMVRHLVGGLIQVGAKRTDKAFLVELLESCGEKKCLFKAKPQGLYLQEVFYEED